MPAMPIVDPESTFPLNMGRYSDLLTTGKFATGLTEREEMAMHMMASLTSVYWDTMQEYKSGADLIKCQSETAVEMVDALLAELERTK